MSIREFGFDWSTLAQLQKRLPITEQIERTALVVKTVGYERANDPPWASLKNIEGRSSFFTTFNSKIEDIDDFNLFISYIRAQTEACHNQSDHAWLVDQQKRLDAFFTKKPKARKSTARGTRETKKSPKSQKSTAATDSTSSRAKGTSRREAPPKKQTYSRLQPKNFVRDCLKNALTDNTDLLQLISHALSDGSDDHDLESVVSYFTDITDQDDRDFPLRRFRKLLKRMRDKKATFSETLHRTSLVVIKDLLTVASFPKEDMQRMENAMIQVLAEDSASMDSAELNAHNQRDAEKLLIATRIKLSGNAFDDWQIPQLLNHDFSASKDFSILMEKVLVVPEPPAPPDKANKPEWYAESCLVSLGYDPDTPSSSVDVFQDVLIQNADEDTVVAMFITYEKVETIKILRQSFPRLLLVVLSEKNALRYSQIYIDLVDTDNLLKRMLGSPANR